LIKSAAQGFTGHEDPYDFFSCDSHHIPTTYHRRKYMGISFVETPALHG
jgi:hypothetical protein